MFRPWPSSDSTSVYTQCLELRTQNFFDGSGTRRTIFSVLTRIIHEGFYCNRRYAVLTGVLAPQSVNILFKYASLLPGCACPSHNASQRFRHEPS